MRYRFAALWLVRVMQPPPPPSPARMHEQRPVTWVTVLGAADWPADSRHPSTHKQRPANRICTDGDRSTRERRHGPTNIHENHPPLHYPSSSVWPWSCGTEQVSDQHARQLLSIAPSADSRPAREYGVWGNIHHDRSASYWGPNPHEDSLPPGRNRTSPEEPSNLQSRHPATSSLWSTKTQLVRIYSRDCRNIRIGHQTTSGKSLAESDMEITHSHSRDKQVERTSDRRRCQKIHTESSATSQRIWASTLSLVQLCWLSVPHRESNSQSQTPGGPSHVSELESKVLQLCCVSRLHPMWTWHRGYETLSSGLPTTARN